MDYQRNSGWGGWRGTPMSKGREGSSSRPGEIAVKFKLSNEPGRPFLLGTKHGLILKCYTACSQSIDDKRVSCKAR